jgi:hypothetical protein
MDAVTPAALNDWQDARPSASERSVTLPLPLRLPVPM